jgi:hypothetical protein
MPLHTLLHSRHSARLAIANLVLAAMAAIFLALSAGAALAAGRVALVMVAEDYQKLQKSSIGAKRANDIAEALKGLGFTVTVSTNPSNSGARAFLKDFSGHVADADLALVVLAGHSTAAGGQSFFLPVNADIGASTDLLSRGISITAVTQIVSRAKAGGVFVLMTAPSFPSPVDGLDGRPEFTAEVPANVVAVFSSSAKVPISNVDATSEQAAEGLARALRHPDPSFADAVKAAAKEVGVVFGKPAEISLARPAEPVVQEASAGKQEDAAATAAAAVEAQRAAEAQKSAQEAQAKLDSERQAREAAEQRSAEDQARAAAAQAEAKRAQADVARAEAEAKKAQADAERAVADAERAKAQARQVEAQAELAKAQAEAARAAEVAVATTAKATPDIPLDEKLMGAEQRQKIQTRLKELGLYTGPIDAIMGPLTREAIMGFQRNRGETVTGFLTPSQFQDLLPAGN